MISKLRKGPLGLFSLLAALAIIPALAWSDEILSLRGEVAVDEAEPTPEMFNIEEGDRIKRAYRQQPPLIPHRIDKYEVDLKVNQCLRCHDWPYYVEEKATKISETHYESREGKRLDFIAGTRWFCTQCHVPQMDAAPLVENEFQPAFLDR